LYAIVVKNKSGPKIKQPKCSICEREYYAKGYCRVHYQNINEGRQLQPNTCVASGCKIKVLIHVKEQLCSRHYAKHLKDIRPKRIFSGGAKWGYKDYRRIQKLKKSKCETCLSRDMLVIHHVDFNPGNSDSKNLKTLCKSCHAKVHKWGRWGKKS
jgi:hypothetical protein